MGRKAKIIWTVMEQADFYNAFVTGLAKRGCTYPLKAANLKPIMEAAREALLVLKVERRRDMSSIDSIRGELAERLVGNGIFPRDYLSALRRPGSKASLGGEQKQDPKDVRIAGLEEQLKRAEQELEASEEENRMMEEELLEMRKQPSPARVLQHFVAETLAMALTMHEDSKKPAFLGQPKLGEGPLPKFEKDRRNDPLGAGGVSQQRVNGSKPKFALVADFVGDDKGALHNRLVDVADLRYLDGPEKMHGMKMFNANGGRIIVWADYCPQDWEKSLTAMGVSFHRHRGTLMQLVEHVRAVAQRKA